jgi:hypothetical protein
MRALQESIKKSGYETVAMGGTLLVMPFGGRVIGIFPDGKTNVAWVHEKLEAGASLEGEVHGGGWLNLGGDRTWISPEIDTHIKDPENIIGSGYEVPKSVDPGDFRVVRSDTAAVRMENEMSVHFARAKRTVEMHFEKEIVHIGKAPIDVPAGVHFTGYKLKTELSAKSTIGEEVKPGIWNILQTPGDVQIIIPVKEGKPPRKLIGDPEYVVDGNTIRCDVKTKASYKFAVHADNSRGMTFFLNSQADPASLVVRRFAVVAPERYGDVPVDDLNAVGFMHQVYVDDGGLGGFGEVEYHAPYLSSANEYRVEDSCDTWAFLGKRESIEAMFQKLLSETE